jgi:hypothetical protein
MIKVLFWIFILWFSICLGLANYRHSKLLFASFDFTVASISVVNLVRFDP